MKKPLNIYGIVLIMLLLTLVLFFPYEQNQKPIFAIEKTPSAYTEMYNYIDDIDTLHRFEYKEQSTTSTGSKFGEFIFYTNDTITTNNLETQYIIIKNCRLITINNEYQHESDQRNLTLIYRNLEQTTFQRNLKTGIFWVLENDEKVIAWQEKRVYSLIVE